MDVAAALETNRYFEETKEGAKGPKVERGEEGFIDYEWIGRTQSGLGAFRLTEAESVDATGKRYRSLMLSIERWVSLGDRVVPKLIIKGNVVGGRVEFTLPSCRSRCACCWSEHTLCLCERDFQEGAPKPQVSQGCG